jgi:16S rRNA (cytidine1402-2'-O)-methyltransferase
LDRSIIPVTVNTGMKKTPQTPATLYIVATPIGNLADISFRAIETLKSVSFIFAEDTRSFSRIKNTYKIDVPCESYHEHNENARTNRIIDLLSKGNSIALVSEAGTPLISDPGYRIVKTAREAGFRVSPIPGACAAIAALSASGLETDQFIFLGFLPVKSGKKKTVLTEALSLNCTIICYESPHRIIKTLDLLEDISPHHPICSAREISKLYEDIFNGTPAEVKNHLLENSAVKGEFVILIGKLPKKFSNTERM